MLLDKLLSFFTVMMLTICLVTGLHQHRMHSSLIKISESIMHHRRHHYPIHVTLQ